MRQTLFLITLLLPMGISASCPELKYVIDSIHDIREALLPNSGKVVVINEQQYQAKHDEPSQAVDDLLAGHFQSYIIERLKETTPDECHYRLRDDRTTVHGSFILSPVR